jgi:hypothetical protein
MRTLPTDRETELPPISLISRLGKMMISEVADGKPEFYSDLQIAAVA